MGEADVLRKAMGKKSLAVMAEQKEKFVSGGEAKGFQRAKVAELWEYIEPFAGYGFNKSHSVAYAMLAYKTAYLKAHYPGDFMAAMLTSEMGTSDNVRKYVRDCRTSGIGVLAPDVNKSGWGFGVEGDEIRFGLGAVKGVGEGAIEVVLEARRRVGRFESLEQFCTEVDLRQINRKVIECLLKAGCFDSLEENRRMLFDSLDKVLGRAQRRRHEREIGQSSLFGGEEPAPQVSSDSPWWSNRERLELEREVLGLFLSGNPLQEYETVLAKRVTHSMESLMDLESAQVCLGGLVTGLRQTKIKNGPNTGRFMGRFALEGLDGAVAVALFADEFEKFRRHLEDGAAVLVSGLVRERGGDIELRAEKIEALGEMDRRAQELVLEVGPGVSMSQMLELRNLLVEHPGSSKVVFRVRLPEANVAVAAGEEFRVSPDPSLLAAAEALLGAGRVSTRELERQPV
jgi:DNA polymerase-3 subunit alpha